ncbi:MAG: methyltransferase [Candidatus Peribacteraceae bacterium]|nr:methyltransferase [Candidatus Peribacteraceae bacterium]HCI04210.1 SAM-dependent methyltransferase [Candidatus Peribacteria bacterium]
MLIVFAFVSTVIGTIWAKVPFVPTPKKTNLAMIEAAELKGNEVVYDLGSGDGRMLIRAKKKYPGIRATGYEIVPMVWFLGRIRKIFLRSDVDLRFGDAFKADISDADCIFLYMTTNLMVKLGKKFDKELKPGTKVISHAFQFWDKTPIKEVEVPAYFGCVDKIYVYEW